MRVLFVFFGNDYHGGTTYSTFTIVQELVRRGHDVHAYVRVTPSGVLSRDLEALGVTVHDGRAPIVVYPKERRPLYKVIRFGLEQARRFYSAPKAEREIATIIESCGIELVSLCSGAIVAGARAAAKAGVPYVWHCREFMQEDHGLDYYPWAHAYELMTGAQCLLCVSQAVKDKMSRVCPESRAEVVYNGIDESVFHQNGRVERAADEPLRLMFGGGISHTKGTFLVLDALARGELNQPYTLDVYGNEGTGDNSAANFAKRCEELEISQYVYYRGRTPSLADEYRRHDIVLVASRSEAFGRVTVEAMLCGCAVVGSDSGGTPELVAEERGYLFVPGDVTSLAEALATAASDDVERKRRTAAARAYAREHFSVNAYVDRVEALYQSALA